MTEPRDIEQESELRRMVEAILFAAQRPVSIDDIQARLPTQAEIVPVLTELADEFEGRGFRLSSAGGKYMFQTAPDMAFLLREEMDDTRRLSRAAVETLAIISYHQPVTRSEIEELRGVSLSKGTLDVLLAAEWIRPRGRRQVPGRPILYGTTEHFLVHFGLEEISDLPGIEELKAAGLLEPIDAALERMLEESQNAAQQPELALEEGADELP